ncbi:MAG: hypothetical protein IH851_06220 [Armatimonadetes bacterium]|nr:hypothetical protein [Armatimonadota bacterium]
MPRTLYFMAACSACRSKVWEPYYERQLRKGLSPIQAYVALARRPAHVAFALFHSKSAFVAPNYT